MKGTDLVVVLVTGEIGMVNPDLTGCLNSDGISSLSQNLGDLEVAQYNVGLFKDTEANSDKSCVKRPLVHLSNENVTNH